MKTNLSIWLLFALNTNIVISGQIQCRDESGEVVDWYVVYKFPRLAGKDQPFDSGLRYAYITSNIKDGFQYSDFEISDQESIFGKTLAPLYSDDLSSDISRIVYNDQPPKGSGKTSSKAHAKGVVAADSTQGFWLIHSIPQFTSDPKKHVLKYPKSGDKYGQMALCISMAIGEISKVVDQILVIRPEIFSMELSHPFNNSIDSAQHLQDMNWSDDELGIRSLTSMGGMNFTSFSKSKYNEVDLYSKIVGPKLNVNMYAETWRRNPGAPLASFCKRPPFVQNVYEMSPKFQNSELTGNFKYLNDHSKWAISNCPSQPYVCIGDINRMGSQYKRGGGTTCFAIPQVWKYWFEWINKVETCSRKAAKHSKPEFMSCDSST